MDVVKILDKLSEHGLVRLNKPMGEWYSVYCPFHNDGNERRASCGCSMHMQVRGGTTYPEGMWHCFACGVSYDMPRAVTEILKNHNISQSGQEWLVQNVPGFEPESNFEFLVPEDMMNALQSKYAVENLQSLVQPEQTFVSEEELASYRYTVDYMYERKLTDEVIEKYDIGYDANWIPPGRSRPVPCITFPVRDKQGRTLFFCRRSIQGKMYHYPEGSLKPVYGIDMIPTGTRSVIICESCINALTAVTYGYAAVALLGTGNAFQMQQLKELGVSEFVICTDGDEAGRRAANKLKKNLNSVALIWTVPMPDGKDLNDLSKEEFDKLYSERE